MLYLSEDSGHRDIEIVKRTADRGSKAARDLIRRHEKAIDILARMLRDEDLYVRHPHRATGPKPGQNMEDKHAELFAIFSRYYFEGDVPYRQALANAVLKMDNYYSRRHGDRIVKARLKAMDEETE